MVLVEAETAGRVSLLSQLCLSNGLVEFQQTDLDALVNDVKARANASGIDSSAVAEAFSRGLGAELQTYSEQLNEPGSSQGGDAGSLYLKAKCPDLARTYPELISATAATANPLD